MFTYLDFFGDPPAGGAKVDELKESYRKGQVADIEVKNYLYESLLKYFANARQTYKELVANPAAVKKILENGAEKARVVAGETMREVREVVGLVNRYSHQLSPSGLGTRAVSSQQEKNKITIEEFGRVEMRVGKVVEATYPPKSEKLIRLVVDFGSEKRIIFTGVRGFGYTPEDFFDKQFFFITNLAPRKMPSYVMTPAGKMAEESQGMILAVDTAEKPLFLSAEGMPVGAKIR